jgi:hypothetical protein
MREVNNFQTVTSVSLDSGVDYIADIFNYTACASSIMGLHRYTNDAGAVEYSPVLLFSDGVHAPFYYHQKNGTSGAAVLDAVDGPYTHISYLANPPRGRYMARYKEHLFVFNTDESGARFHFSGDYYGVWPINIWPALYFKELEGTGDITGVSVLNGQMYIFTERATWMLSGEGIEGKWSIRLIDANHGANHGLVVNTGTQLFFANDEGVFLQRGGTAVNISHPRLWKSWQYVDLHRGGNLNIRGTYLIHDPESNRVILGNYPRYLVYDITHDAWSRWGEWGTTLDDYHTSYAIFLSPIVSDIYTGKRQVYGYTTTNGDFFAILKNRTNVDTTVGGTHAAIPWFIRTQRHFTEDPELKLCRHTSVTAKKTGDWEMTVLVLKDGLPPELAMLGNNTYVAVTDAVNNSIHRISKTKANAGIVEGDTFDGYLQFANYKLWDSAGTVTGASVNRVQFSSSQDSSAYDGEIVLLAEDTNPSSLLTMFDEDYHILDNAACSCSGGGAVGFDATSWELVPDASIKMTSSTNVKGRDFALWLSNVGSYLSSGQYAKPGMATEITGYGMWIRPLRVRRP